ncbi:MAG: cytochrome c oxidase subunit I [Dehalococcoidia bacterium]|nr:cytochrome c oxidase subunit I [Dehalococcoidia bacterium]MCA9849355.1 cytochrome c oxidase subunit I [Dehalococcoidia bacterium]MCA9855926.1 cytochrome c oxidase subunit I [Dehalococcoidia bacterium]MCB9490983.1 cytochrome c oxidase subunit I [Dehalococcoidia bacterium]
MATAVGTVGQTTEHSKIWEWMTTVDHKKIASLYGVTGFTFFLVGGIEALLVRTQLARPEGTVLDADLYNQLFSTHALTMIFLAIMPLGASFFNYFIPLQIGARDVAFPRLNALGYWMYLSGGLMLTLSFFFGGAPDGGWFGYAPLSTTAFAPGRNMDFYTVSLLILGSSSLIASLNFVVTIINMRAPGMTMMRLPVYMWMTLVVAFLLVLSLPVVTVGLIQLYFDRNFGTNFFTPATGGDPILWQHIFWIFGHPEVYVLILPSMGIVSEVLPVMSRKPLFGYAAIVFAGAAIGVLGFGVWSHHMFTTGLGTVPQVVFSASTMAIGIPTGIKIFNWLGTMYGGNIRFTTATYYAVGFIALFTIGGISGVMHASPAVDTQHQDSYFVVAHIHYVLFGGAIMGIFSGIYYWFPKMTGRFLDETLGKVSFWVMFIGMNMTFFPMHFLGISGMPRRIYTYESGLGWDTWNLVATIGAYIMAFGVLLFVINFFKSMRQPQTAPDNPWGGSTLEWATSSPPPEHNFDVIPEVRDRDPLWYNRDHGIELPPKPEHMHIHMPPPSYYPLIIGAGVTLVGLGLLAHLGVAVAGALVVVYGVWGWALEPTD